MRKPTQHLELDPQGSDFLGLLRDMGHVDEALIEELTTRLVLKNPDTRVIPYEELRKHIASMLFEREDAMRPDLRDLLRAEWSRFFG